MTVSQLHKAVVDAYREALEGSDFADIKITPIDRESDDLVRHSAETEYDASYSRECSMTVTTVRESLYYYATDPHTWKLEINNFQQLIEERLLKGIDEIDADISEVNCESGGGALHISFVITHYDITDFDDTEEKPVMETLTQNLEV